MNSLKDFIKQLESQLNMNNKELRDFKIAADHNMNCNCSKCKNYWKIMNQCSEE